MSQVSEPEIYKESSDFRFFLRWFELALSSIQYDTENLFDLYDPLRCKAELLWLLGDTMGFRYDDRVPAAVNRLILVYFMSMIRLRGSKDGVTLAAEVNLAQFNLLDYGKEKEILYNRLEDTSIPANSVYVNPVVQYGYIDVVYFSEEKPIDTCIEYVRPLGMYLFQHAGVRLDVRSKITVDARLTDAREVGLSVNATSVGHYTREDYASLQRAANESNQEVNPFHTRKSVWYRNSDVEEGPDPSIDPGYRSLYSLQLANNEHVVRSLIPHSFDPNLSTSDAMRPAFSLGFGPQDVGVHYPDDYLAPPYREKPVVNLRYNRDLEEYVMSVDCESPDVFTVDDGRSPSIIKPRPAVNPIMTQIGDAISRNELNTEYDMHKGERFTTEKFDS